MMRPSDSDTRHLPSDPKGSRAQQAMVDGSQEVTTDTKQIPRRRAPTEPVRNFVFVSSAADGAMMQPSDSDTRHLPPDPKGSRAQQAMVDGSQEVTTDTNFGGQIHEHDAVHRQEPLRLRSRGEPPHLSLTLAGRLVRHFRPIVLVLLRETACASLRA